MNCPRTFLLFLQPFRVDHYLVAGCFLEAAPTGDLQQHSCGHNSKHNGANLENNLDGTNDNNSWNSGKEGETEDPEVNRLRRQRVKNHLCMLFFASGTPMMLGGDEFLRTQRGNNNGYCQDNEISWFDWQRAAAGADVTEFVRKAIAFTHRCSILQRRKFFLGHDRDADRVPDISWYGTGLDGPAWHDPEQRTLCYLIDGGEELSVLGKYFLFMILNADFRSRRIQVPAAPGGARWLRVVDTSLPSGEDFLDPEDEVVIDPPDHYWANARSTVVLIAR